MSANWWDDTTSQTFRMAVGDAGTSLFAGKHGETLNSVVGAYLERVRDEVPAIVNRTPMFHASEIGDGCARFEVFKRVLPRPAEQRRFNGELLLRFELGHAIHKHWQGRLLGKARVLRGTWRCNRCMHTVQGYMPKDPCPKCEWQINPKTAERALPSRMSVDCATVCSWPEKAFFDPKRDCAQCERGGHWGFVETRVLNKDLELDGSTDGVLLLDGQEWVLELKSLDVYVWSEIIEPYEKHVTQATVYMMGLGIPRAVIAYVDKNSGLMKEFRIELDLSLVGTLKGFISGVQGHVAKGTIPNGPCGGPKDERAKGCGYRDVCFKGATSVADLRAQKLLPVVEPAPVETPA